MYHCEFCPYSMPVEAAFRDDGEGKSNSSSPRGELVELQPTIRPRHEGMYHCEFCPYSKLMEMLAAPTGGSLHSRDYAGSSSTSLLLEGVQNKESCSERSTGRSSLPGRWRQRERLLFPKKRTG
ncbi:gastrula zinc finger protein XlCGF17.1 [Ixodes scapularis]